LGVFDWVGVEVGIVPVIVRVGVRVRVGEGV
jgi:hypothetical protein